MEIEANLNHDKTYTLQKKLSLLGNHISNSRKMIKILIVIKETKPIDIQQKCTKHFWAVLPLLTLLVCFLVFIDQYIPINNNTNNRNSIQNPTKTRHLWKIIDLFIYLYNLFYILIYTL